MAAKTRHRNSSVVAAGDVVRVHYTARTNEGAVFETSANREPLKFVAGGDQVVSGVSRAVIGMQPGEKKTVVVPPAEAFGERETALEVTLDAALLPDNASAGDQMTASFADRELDVWIQKLDAGVAVVDVNHPLAGETLVYDIELVDVRPDG